MTKMTFGDLENLITKVGTAHFMGNDKTTIKNNPRLQLKQAIDVKELEDLAEIEIEDMFKNMTVINYVRRFKKLYSNNRLRKLKLKILNESNR